MEQKLVSFKIAKVLEKAGYPQATEYWYNEDGELCYSLSDLDEVGYISCPTYLSTWLWIVRKKKALIDVMTGNTTECYIYNSIGDNHYNSIAITDPEADPEEAIAKAIDFLVENNLIK